MDYLLGIDIGTSGTKGVLMDRGGQNLCSSRERIFYRYTPARLGRTGSQNVVGSNYSGNKRNNKRIKG
jgi:sugar (pentulose or hexulose) kinase